MAAKSCGHSHPFIGSKIYLANAVAEFEEVRGDENFQKLFYFINTRVESTVVPNADYLQKLSSKTILKEVCLYSPTESKNFNHAMTNKEKLFLLYGLYHNYLWRTFDLLYNPMIEGSERDDCAGGCPHSQDYLMIMGKDIIKQKTSNQEKLFYSGLLDEVEGLRDRLHDEKELIKRNLTHLSQSEAAKNKLFYIVHEDGFTKKYFEKLELECKAEIHFTYKHSEFEQRLRGDKIVLTPDVGAHNIDIKQLRNILSKIFKIPTIVQMFKPPSTHSKRRRLKKNSEKGRLY